MSTGTIIITIIFTITIITNLTIITTIIIVIITTTAQGVLMSAGSFPEVLSQRILLIASIINS